MAETVDNLVLEHLRPIRAILGRIETEVYDLKGRTSGVENGLVSVRRDLVSLAEADARLQVAVDRQSERLDRIERRLELKEA